MKRFMLTCFLLCALGLADNQSRPIIHLASSPGQVTYYSSPFAEASKFDFQCLEWDAFVRKHKYGYTLVEGQWVRELLQDGEPSASVRLFIPPSERRGGLIVTPTISQPASNK